MLRFPAIDAVDRVEIADAYSDWTGKYANTFGCTALIWGLYSLIFAVVVVRLILDQLGLLAWGDE